MRSHIPVGLRPPLSPRVQGLPWLGPREVVEQRGWPVLPVGGSPSVDHPDHVVEAVVSGLRHPSYAGTRGLPELCEAIAEELERDTDVSFDPEDEVLVTVGSMQALHLAASVCVAAGTRAVSHAPSFFYEDLAAMAGITCVWTGGEDGQPDWNALANAVDETVSLVFVNTPCNPTGYVFTESDLEALARAVHGRNCWIVSDEAYRGYEHDGRVHLSPAVHPDLRARTLVARSFSKTFALAPYRVGYIAGDAEAIAAMAKFLQYSIIAVDAIAQRAALAALQGPRAWLEEIVRSLGEARHRVVAAVQATGFLAAEAPQAGSTIWARITNAELTEEALSQHLGREYGIPAVQGCLFGASTPHLRIPFGGDPAARETMIERLARVQPPVAQS